VKFSLLLRSSQGEHSVHTGAKESPAGAWTPSSSERAGRSRGLSIGSLFLSPATLCAIAIIAFAVALRFVIGALGYPQDDGDEGTMGIMALHILHAGEHPIYFYSQQYMGALEAYLGAFFFGLFGTSILSLRLGALLLSAAFLACAYLLARLLFPTSLALVALALLSLGTKEMLDRQIEAAGGYSEMLLFGATALLLASWLAARSAAHLENILPRERRLRWLAFFGWGLVVGLGLWSDMLVLPFVLTSTALLIAFCHAELRTRAGLLLLAGVLLGASPIIFHDLTSPLEQSALAVTWQLQHQGGSSSVSMLAKGVLATLTVSLPNVLGATSLCGISIADAWPLSTHALGCTTLRTGWALGYLLLFGLAVALAVRPLWAYLRHGRMASLSADDRRAAALYAARLAILVSGALVLLAYVSNPIDGHDPWPSTRYLLDLLLTFPAVLWPLWSLRSGSGSHSRLRLPLARHLRLGPRPGGWSWSTLARVGVLALLVTVFARGSVIALTVGVYAHDTPNYQQALIASLERAQVRHIYTDYWNCDSIAFQTNERITCAVLNPSLNPGLDRYTPYLASVQADPCAPYVFPETSPQAIAITSGHLGHIPPAARKYSATLDRYVVYSPCRAIPS
jgi:hypothetical protein